MLYQISNGAVELGAELILKKINFEIRGTEKIAIVGRNGCGKTTLLKLISGEIDLKKRDSDEDVFIAKAGNLNIGYLKQMTFLDDSITADEEIRKVFHKIHQMEDRMKYLLEILDGEDGNKRNNELYEREIKEYTHLQEEYESIGGYYYEKEYDTMLRQFGFSLEDKYRPLSEFSGGQQTKLAFIKLLLSKPDVLLLDEPTNHLDISTIEWLEGYLQNYKKAVVIVSHDRMFVDKIVDVVYEIEYKVLKRYPGNYTKFMKTKQENYEKQKKDYEMQQKEIARLQMIVEKYKNTPSKVAMTRSKLKMIEHMEIIESPDRFDTHSFHANFKQGRETGKEVLRVNKLQIGYDKVLSTVTMDQVRGQRIGIIGGNGEGKSTFLKTLVEVIPSLGGEYQFGYQVDLGYFDQHMAQYASKKTVLDDFWDEYPNLEHTEVRSALGAFMFSQDDVFKTVDMLSGGEKVRLALCKLFKTKPNYLILDEPTNHMDIIGKETLESVIQNFTGSVLFVSHDRYFIQQMADALLLFENGKATYLPYGYEEYVARRDGTYGSSLEQGNYKKEWIDTTNKDSQEKEAVVQKGKEAYKYGKEISRLEKKRTKAEERIDVLEEEISSKKEELLKPEHASSYSKLEEISKKIEDLEEELMEAMEEWDDIDKQLENLTNL